MIVGVLAFRLSGVTAAGAAFTSAMILWALGIFSPPEVNHLRRALSDSLVLELLVGLVVFCGLVFVEVSRRGGALEALSGIINSLNLDRPRAVILITLGVGVMIESLTGYGVSMLLTVPLLLQIVDRDKTMCLALIGMSLMPWGALSVAALLGAELAALSPEALAHSVVTTSGPIAVILPLACLLFVREITSRDLVYALLSGVVLTVGIASASRWIGVEAAGVGGGLSIIFFMLLSAGAGKNFCHLFSHPGVLPYGFLISGVVLQKLVSPHLSAFRETLTIATEGASFSVLDSPAVALIGASLLVIAMRPVLWLGSENPPLLGQVAKRSWRALLSILLFLLAARIMVEVGGISALAAALSDLGHYPAVAVVAFLGGVGAYVTGSGVTSNALFMPSAAATGQSLDCHALFAALQHSGAGHVAMASLPVIALLLTALPQRMKDDERIAMRMGLVLAAFWMLIIIASGMLQVGLSNR